MESVSTLTSENEALVKENKTITRLMLDVSRQCGIFIKRNTALAEREQTLLRENTRLQQKQDECSRNNLINGFVLDNFKEINTEKGIDTLDEILSAEPTSIKRIDIESMMAKSKELAEQVLYQKRYLDYLKKQKDAEDKN